MSMMLVKLSSHAGFALNLASLRLIINALSPASAATSAGSRGLPS